MNRPKITADNSGPMVNKIRVKRVVIYDEGQGEEYEWIDLIGGRHGGGVGVDPDGDFCGECNEIACAYCAVYHNTLSKENKNMRIVVTPDKEYAAEMRKKLKENNRYCPCRIEKTPDTKCMCKEFRDQIERNEPGVCHCGLYFAEREDQI